MNWNFWYSAKQEEICRHLDRHEATVLINGERVAYTECSEQDQPSGRWDDYQFLGQSDPATIRVGQSAVQKSMPVTAREDQPQLGTCDRNCWPHIQVDTCENWKPVAPEDQPRPTPPQCPKCFSNSQDFRGCPLHEPWGAHAAHYGACEECRDPWHNTKAGETQGEAPQADAGQGVTYLTCGHCGKETMYDARAVMEITRKSLVETGAHPSQDATIQKLWQLRDDVEMFIQHDGATGSVDYDAAKTFHARHLMLQTVVQLRGERGARSTPSLPANSRASDDFWPLVEECYDALHHDDQSIEEFHDWCENSPIAKALSECYELGRRDGRGSTPSPDPPPPDAEQQLTDIAFYPRSANPADKQLVVYLGDAIDILARTVFPRPQQEAYNNLNVDRYHEIQDLKREVERLREALRGLVEKYDATISMCPAEFVSNSDGQEFEAVIERGRAALAPSLPTKGEK